MTKQLESLDEFAKKNKIYRGEWELSYCDDNYLLPDNFIKIGKITFDDVSIHIDEENKYINNAFTLYINNQNNIIESLKQCLDKHNNQKANKEQIDLFIQALFQELSKSLTRIGIITPDIDEKSFDGLQSEYRLTLVHDTNAIINGTTNYLLCELNNKNIWNIIPKISQLEFQEKSSSVRKQETDIKHLPKIKDRAFSTNALRVINQIKEKYLLEYIGDSSGLAITNRQGDKRNVLYDRLIIETIKSLYGSRNTNSKVVLITSDFDMARFAKMDNIDVLYSTFRTLKREGDSFYSVRFSLISKKFHCCSIYELLWDFTNLFSKIKIENKKDKKTFVFFYYTSNRKLDNWEKDQLEIEYIDYTQEYQKKVSAFSNKNFKAIKMIGLDNILDIIEILYTNKEIGIETCINQLKLSKETFMDYIQVFEGIGLVKIRNESLIATDLVDIFIKEWDEGNNDNLISIFRNYIPFDMFLNMMIDIKNISKFKINPEITKKTLEKYGINDYKAMRVFPNIGVRLGILYPSGDKIYWANEQPAYETFERSFLDAYNKHKITEGYASMADLINEVCINLNISYYTFIQLFKNFHRNNSNKMRTGGSVITASKNAIELLNSRSNEQRFNKIVLEDGIMISDNVIKSIKIG